MKMRITCYMLLSLMHLSLSHTRPQHTHTYIYTHMNLKYMVILMSYSGVATCICFTQLTFKIMSQNKTSLRLIMTKHFRYKIYIHFDQAVLSIQHITLDFLPPTSIKLQTRSEHTFSLVYPLFLLNSL